jgi:hypothetical protein
VEYFVGRIGIIDPETQTNSTGKTKEKLGEDDLSQLGIKPDTLEGLTTARPINGTRRCPDLLKLL